jgi:asparagine synthase (glutamine-hydrolysing)
LVGEGVGTGLSDEEAALAMYEKEGVGFARRLNGAFVVGVWDGMRNRVVVTNDRFGLYPEYYSYSGKRLVFGPEVKGILCDRGVRKELDWVALAQYMRFQHLLGERTFFEGVKLLPAASVMVYDAGVGTCEIKKYWGYEEIGYRGEVSFEEAVEEASRLLQRAVRRLSEDEYRPGVYLSGGLDSRTIVGMVKRRPVVSLTYGVRGCRDVCYARQVAGAVGSDHHWFELEDGRWVQEHASLHLELTEGFHSWIHAHGMSTLAGARELMDVNLTGWDGGTIMGHADNIDPLLISPVDDRAFLTYLFYQYNQKWTWPSITEGEERLLYCEPVWKKVDGLAFESFREELAPYLGYRTDVRGEFFFIDNHIRRLTQNMVKLSRSHIEVRFPFFNYDLIDFIYSLPAMLRADRRLQRAVIQSNMPRLAYIPYEHDEFLPTTRTLLRQPHALAMRMRHRFKRWHLWPFPVHCTLYADYEGYLRGELREWAEGILFDRCAVERGIFDPSSVRTLMDRHLSGLEEWTIGKIAPIMTYEMMLRRLYDQC